MQLLKRVKKLNSTECLGVLAVSLVLLVASGCQEQPAEMGDRGATERATQGANREGVVALEILDDEKVFSEYAGSESCRECHQEAFDKWHQSNHGMAERLPDLEADGEAFRATLAFVHGGGKTIPKTEGDQLWLEENRQGREPETYGVERVIGHDPLRQYLINLGKGRLQAMEAAYDPHRKDWFLVYEDDRQPGDWGHWTGRGMNWNAMCASCHNTRYRKHYDPVEDSYASTFAEMTVGCESCHGPMANHVQWQAEHPQATGDPHVAAFEPAQMMQNCAPCHSRRSELTGEFEPGDAYFDHYHLTVPDESDLYYPDGQVRDEVYVYTSFMSSKMHAAGVTCMDCHDPHTQQIRQTGNALCLRCHSGGYPNSPIIKPSEHTFHAPGSEGDSCVGCHMPHTTYMQRHPRRDHGFTIPDPLLTKKHGTPNACNRCHTDKDADWALAYVESWYGDRMDRDTRSRAEAVFAVREGRELGWKPVVEWMESDEASGFWKAVGANLLERWTFEPRVLDVLVSLIDHPNPLVRANAVQSLTDLPPDAALTVRAKIRPLLEDSVRSVRVAAAWALRRELQTDSVAGGDLTRFLNFNRDQPTGMLQLAVFYLDRGQPDEAARLIEGAIEWDPNSAGLRHELAVVYSTLGRHRDALTEMEEACRLDPSQAEFQYKVGLAWNELGNLDKAIQAMEKAAEVDPRHARALYNLGLAYHQKQQPEDAVEALVRAESAEPEDPRIPYARATILMQQADFQGARAAAERALEIIPNYGPAVELIRSLPF